MPALFWTNLVPRKPPVQWYMVKPAVAHGSIYGRISHPIRIALAGLFPHYGKADQLVPAVQLRYNRRPQAAP